MKLIINENYRLETDPLNVTLLEKYECKKEGKKTGEVNYKVIGYYSNFKQALQGCLRRNIMISDLEGLQLISNRIETAYEEIIEVAKSIDYKDLCSKCEVKKEKDEEGEE